MVIDMDKLKETWAKLPTSAKVFVGFVGAVLILEIINNIPT